MIDDERLQELLSQASSLYNNGEYRGAIGAWQEALTVDPGSRKAMEGIRMATLLLGEWEPRGPGAAPEEAAPVQADGAAGGGPEVPPEEMEATVDLGVARVRQLLAERKYQEAIEGARALLPMAPHSEEIQRLIDEAQQAFEAAPFVEEHLTLARELLEQERFAEAEAECRKIFVLDKKHPEGRALLKQIRDRVQGSLQRAASQLGGMTVKLTLPEVLAAGEAPALEPPETSGADPFEMPGSPQEPTIVEAKTIVPPSMRMQPARPATGPAAGPPQAASDRAKAPTVSIPVADSAAADDPSAWEMELTQLNLKEGERGLLRGTAAKATGTPVDPGDGVDLMSLLDNDVGGGSEKPGAGTATAPRAPGGPAPPAGVGGAAPLDPSTIPTRKAAVRPKEAPRTGVAARETPADHEAESTAPTTRTRGAERPPVPAATGSRSSFLKFAALLGILVLVGGGVAWWFFFQPRTSSGAGSPGQLAMPPAGSPAGAATATAEGPIPTPIGGSGRPQTREPSEREEASVASEPPAIEISEVPVGAPPVGTTPATDPGRPLAVRREPIKPAGAAPLSPEEARRKVAAYTADGQRLMRLGKWREARAKFNAVLALDPVNFGAKELADQAQAKIEEEQRLQDDVDSARRLIAEKDFENALRKLYRLPRDRGLGDLDLFIRNAWFNWAVILMKAGNAAEALQKLSEVLAIDPDDAEALKLQEVAERYVSRAKDRVYFAFTAGLKLRAYDQK
ncbi:MAG: tetratricopeptide repeat protein [Acidobacteria bacterium]|nr:tetratricopeptide repeat protein [Acidobacteriota bacterium]